MNTEQQAIEIARKIGSLIEVKKGELTITLYNPAITLKVKVRHFHTTFNENGFAGHLVTFTNDINNLTTYDIYNIRDVS